MAPRARVILAAVLESTLIAGSYLVLAWLFQHSLERKDWVLAFLTFALAFPGVDRLANRQRGGLFDIVLAWIFVVLALLAGGWASGALPLFRGDVLVLWAVVTPALLWFTTTTWQRWQQRHAARAAGLRAVIVGDGPHARTAISALTNVDHDRLELLGIFDDRDVGRLDGEAALPHLGGLRDLPDYIRARQVDKVFITMPLNAQPRIQALLDAIGHTPAEILYVPDVFAVSITQGRLTQLGGLPVVGLLESPFQGMNAVVKRVSDIVLSGFAIVALSPVLLGTALAVRLSSPGPIVFKQKRHGQGARIITVYKFRSMTTQDNGPVVKQATRDDDRVTKVGKFIRKTSLDELPQLINVFQGRMSMVGPRPHAVAHNNQYRNEIEAYMVRHMVKPGITGWAQIHGHRGPTETVDKMRTRVEYDIEYLRNWSLGLDLKILFRTAWLVIHDRNAF